jgi:hypothetical protein
MFHLDFVNMASNGSLAYVTLVGNRILICAEGDKPLRHKNPALTNMQQTTDAPTGRIIGEPVCMLEDVGCVRKLVISANCIRERLPSFVSRSLLKFLGHYSCGVGPEIKNLM